MSQCVWTESKEVSIPGPEDRYKRYALACESSLLKSGVA